MAKKNAMGTIRPKLIQKLIHGESEPKISLGYDKKNIRRFEGECWTDDKGKEWEFKNGTIRSIPIFQDIRIPMFCPKCNSIMGKRSKDADVYYKFGFCLDCLINRDSKMMRDGTFGEYEKKYIKSKQIGFYSEAKIELEEYLKTMKKGYIEYPTTDGKLERWEGDDLRKMKEFWETELELINKELDKLTHGLNEKHDEQKTLEVVKETQIDSLENKNE